MKNRQEIEQEIISLETQLSDHDCKLAPEHGCICNPFREHLNYLRRKLDDNPDKRHFAY